MDLIIVLGALALLLIAAYRGYSVILCAPLAALLAVLLTQPALVAPVYSGLFMDKMVLFLRLYFPVFLLGAVFGKVMETSGFSSAIAKGVVELIGRKRAMHSVVLVAAMLTYGGVSLFVVVFAVYPIAARLFKELNVPKRLIPGAIALGAFSFTMDALPGTPQIQNVIPAPFFKTDIWAAPWLGVIGSVFIAVCGVLYLERRRRQALAAGEGYGNHTLNEVAGAGDERLPNPLVALIPLAIVPILSRVLTNLIPRFYGDTYALSLPGISGSLSVDVAKSSAIWALSASLLVAIVVTCLLRLRSIGAGLAEHLKTAVSGSLLASMNTASEYGFGAVISSLAGFAVVAHALKAIPNPLISEAITVTSLAGITGSASGGLSIALAAMGDTFVATAQAAGIPLQVLHRVASMASGGLDTLPHNGAVITLLAVTGLTHRESYRDIFAVTCIKTVAVFVVIGIYVWLGIY